LKKDSLINIEEIKDCEVNTYLGLPFDPKYESNILIFWKDNEKLLPKLSKLPKTILCVQASESASEQLFSKAGYLMKIKNFKSSIINLITNSFIRFNN